MYKRQDEVIAASKYKVTRHYETPWTEHAFLEPECAVSMPFDGGVLIYSTDQGTYDTVSYTHLDVYKRQASLIFA